MRAAPLPDSALLAPRTNLPADVGGLDAGASPGPPQDRPSVIEQARFTRSRIADLRQRAEGTRRRALALMQETAALMLAAEQIRRPMPRKELLGRSDYARLQARMQTMPVIEQAKGILMAQSRCGPEAAFDLLRRASQRSNMPVRELAAQIVARTAEESAAGAQPGRLAS
jgi:ANTAR domain-containing protein